METKTTTSPNSGRATLERSRRELQASMGDHRLDRPTRLLRLQGWRGAGLQQAVAAGNAHRLAPGFCAIGATAVALTGSWVLALALMGTAVVGIFARNHPVEAIYNRLAPAIGRASIPRNRAAKRLGCLLGTAFLGASTISLGVGASVLGHSFAGAFAVVAWFVTITNICVPSVVFVALFGSERSAARRLV